MRIRHIWQEGDPERREARLALLCRRCLLLLRERRDRQG